MFTKEVLPPRPASRPRDLRDLSPARRDRIVVAAAAFFVVIDAVLRLLGAWT